MNELEISLSVPSDVAEACIRAIDLEAKDEAHDRSSVALSRRGDCLLINIRSDDLSSMRAALNTYLRWAAMCCDLLESKIE